MKRMRSPLSSLSPNLISCRNTNTVQWASGSDNFNEIMKDVGIEPLHDTSSSDNENEMGNIMYRMAKLPRLTKRLSFEKSKNRIADIPARKTCNSYDIAKRTSNCSSQFSKLPNELVLVILAYLPKYTLSNCAKVCKRWNEISCDDSLWKKFDGGGRKRFASGVVGTLIKRGVTTLRLANANIKTPIFVDCLKPTPESRFSKLRFLDLSNVTIPENGLAEILSVCAGLQCLSLENCKINESVMSHIPPNVWLEQLNMTMCQGVTPQCLLHIIESCERLTAWNLGWTDMGIEGLYTLAQKLPASLRRLCISGYRYELVDDILFSMLSHCPSLQELDVSDDCQLTADFITFIVTDLPSLVSLHTSRLYNIHPKCYSELQNLLFFQDLNVFGALPESSLKYIGLVLPHVRLNTQRFCTIARPTTGDRRTSIWGVSTRDNIF